MFYTLFYYWTKCYISFTVKGKTAIFFGSLFMCNSSEKNVQNIRVNFMGIFRGHVIIAEKLLYKNCYEIVYSFGDCTFYVIDMKCYMHFLNFDKIIDFFLTRWFLTFLCMYFEKGTSDLSKKEAKCIHHVRF